MASHNGISAQQIANLNLNEDSMAPMRLNFSNEALGDSNDDILPHDQDDGSGGMGLLN